MNDKSIFNLISAYRTELMGYAILGVFICHIVSRTDNHSLFLHELPRLVYTQGFLFLSGFGLYYSFSKDSHLGRYIKKRIRRLYIPYFLMSLPFFSAIVLVNQQDVYHLVGYLTTIYFWLNGNYYGMWYIAITLFLYLFFPLLYKMMFSDTHIRGVSLKFILIVLLFLVIIIGVKIYASDYYLLVGHWIKKTVMFPIGMFCGYMSTVRLSKNRNRIIVLLVIILAVMVKIRATFFYEYLRSLCGIFSLSILFELFGNKVVFKKLMNALKWLGTYSLELYVIHVLLFKTFVAFSGIDNAFWMFVCIIIALLVCPSISKMIDMFQNRYVKIV